MNDKHLHWLPTAFCATLALIAVVAGVGTSSLGSAEIVFYCFSPMCFFFVAQSTYRLQRENQELHDQIQQIRDDFIGRM